MNAYHLIIAGTLLLVTASARTFGVEPPVLPPPPWLAKAPAMSQWVITYTQATEANNPSVEVNSQPSAAPKPPPRKIEVTKTGTTIFEEITAGSNASVQIWRSQGFILVKSADDNHWFVGAIPPINDPFDEADYSTTDFAGFTWITQKNFVSVQAVEGKTCLVFKDKVLALSANDVSARQAEATSLMIEARRKDPNSNFVPPPIDWDKYKVDAEAAIDIKTHLPVSLKIGPLTRIFQFLPPPSAELQLPEDAQLALDSLQKHTKAVMEMTAGRP